MAKRNDSNGPCFANVPAPQGQGDGVNPKTFF